MGTILLLLLGIIIYVVYLVIEFAIPMALFYFIVSHPDKPYTWVLATLLIIWFIARMTIYIIKETNKNE